MKLSINSKLSKILLMIIIDIIAAVFLNLTLDLDSLIGLLAITFVLLFSVLLYLIIFELRKSVSFYFFINIFLSPVILYLIIIVFAKLKFDEKKFSFRGDDYVLFIIKRSKHYNISKIIDHDESHQYGMINGGFVQREDTTLLFNPPHYLKLYDNKLVGFPKDNDTIILK